MHIIFILNVFFNCSQEKIEFTEVQVFQEVVICITLLILLDNPHIDTHVEQ